ncbi:MAG: M20 family metallopeptidase [Clostridia bacterium]|nr:M20 family metallopeptidase [Clostridia bacterium]
MSIRENVISYVDRNLPTYQQIALDIHANPEVSNYEFFACERLSSQLASDGFDVKVDVAGHRTGFTATYKSRKPGPVIVFLAEYDALAGLGHGCGHNIFGATSALAGATLKHVIEEVGGEVRVYGTPGEEGGENGSAKGSFVREGFLDDVDAALCVHPGSKHHRLTGTSLACAPVDIEFWGQACHACAAWNGHNALDAMILFFNSIALLRQQLTPDIRIHGIITNGGDAPNTIPDYTKAKFYLRADSAPKLDDLYAKVEHIVEGAALATGTKGRMQPYQNRVENQVPTPSFDAVYRKNLESLGEVFDAPEEGKKQGGGSSDVGNVSQVVPTIQPSIVISKEQVRGHSEEMVAASCSQPALEAIGLGAKALVLTAIDLIQDPQLLASIKAEHAEAVKNQ